MSILAQLSSTQRTMLWVLGACSQMRVWGLMAGPDALTTKGLAVWDQLDAEWKPTNDGLKATAVALVSDDSPDTHVGMYTLLKEFRDNRKKMHEFVTGTEQ